MWPSSVGERRAREDYTAVALELRHVKKELAFALAASALAVFALAAYAALQPVPRSAPGPDRIVDLTPRPLATSTSLDTVLLAAPAARR